MKIGVGKDMQDWVDQWGCVTTMLEQLGRSMEDASKLQEEPNLYWHDYSIQNSPLEII